jgi:hypothetical protein
MVNDITKTIWEKLGPITMPVPIMEHRRHTGEDYKTKMKLSHYTPCRRLGGEVV